jgi:3-phosphoshikimate 1-carboxyvinyltransferase
MMNYYIRSNQNITQVTPPISKSYAQRVLWAAALAVNPTNTTDLGNSNDVNHLMSALQKSGVTVEKNQSTICIQGITPRAIQSFHAGESGLAVRLSAILLSSLSHSFVIEGSGSLNKREMNGFLPIMKQLGLSITLNNGKLPARLQGKPKPGQFSVDGSDGSQYLSGLLMLLPLLEKDSLVHVKNLKSKPYIDLTLDVLHQFGIQIEQAEYSSFKVIGNQQYKANHLIQVERDYSSAANWIVYGALNNGIVLNGLLPNSAQGDKEILAALRLAGASYTWKDENLHIYAEPLVPFRFDATDCPDLFPALVVLAAGIKGTSKITGVGRLKNKESDRGKVLQKEFLKLGLRIELAADEMIIYGTGQLNDGEIDSNNDHRIVMAGAIASCLADNGIKILNTEAVNKSDPTFLTNFHL